MRRASIGLTLVAASWLVTTGARAQGDVGEPDAADAETDPTARDAVEEEQFELEGTADDVPLGMQGDDESANELAAQQFDQEALAEEPVVPSRQPVPLWQRPMTLPAGALRVDAYFAIEHYGYAGEDDQFLFDAGAAFGVLDELEVGAHVLPLQFAPDFEFRNIVLWGLYGLIAGDFALGVELELALPGQQDDLRFGLAFGAPMIIRVAQMLRIDTGLFLGLAVGESYDETTFMEESEVVVGLFRFRESPLATRNHVGIPIILDVNVVPQIFLGVSTGVWIGDLGDAADQLYIPLGFHGGYTFAASGEPVGDFTFELVWGDFLFPGARGEQDKIDAKTFTVMFGAEIYLHLAEG